MDKYQDKVKRLTDVLESQGHHITEIYDSAGFLSIYIDGVRKSLLDLSRMAVRK